MFIKQQFKSWQLTTCSILYSACMGIYQVEHSVQVFISQCFNQLNINKLWILSTYNNYSIKF